MNSYKAKYQNQLLPDPIEVDVNLLQNSLIIEVGGGVRHEWFYGMIKSRKNKNGTLRLFSERNKKETLDFSSTEILLEIKRLAPYAEVANLKPWWKTANGLYTALASKVAVVLLGILIYFLMIPFIIDFAIHHVSKETEKSLGDKIKSSFVGEASEDYGATELVNEFISKLKIEGDYKIHVTVLKSKERNAFALPGGEIIIYDNIFSVMKSYTELVALLGHEIGHVEKQHSLKLLAHQGSSAILLAIAVGNMSGATSMIFQNANTFHQLSFSRSYEEEADKYGLELMRNNQIDQEGMADLFAHLKDLEKNEPGIQFISTHPLMEARIENVKNEITKEEGATMEHPELESIFSGLQK